MSPNPAADIQTLSTEYPIALLPVRIETRFTKSPPALRVRIYPDEIFASSHDGRLTDGEYADGVAFWTEAWVPTGEPSAWAKLVARHQASRSAWIAQICTPSNVASRPSGSPQFPIIDRRPEQLPNGRTSALPSAWVVIAYRNGSEITRIVSNAVQSPLQLGFRTDLDENDPSLVAYDELRIEQDLAWTIDFALATQIGMAVTLPLTANDLTLGFDRVVVLGIKAPFDPLQGEKELMTLLEGHHFTRGLAFVRQGTPTNNTGSEPAGYPPPSEATHSLPIERGAPLAIAGSDGARAARALGIDAGVFDHVEGADRREDEAAKTMARALWPCTLGYFLEQIASTTTPQQIADIRRHVAEYVRGRGPFAAFRIGRVPYGLLPMTSLSRWTSSSTDAAETALPRLIETWRKVALSEASRVARVGATSDPDADLLGALALDASTREVRLREAIGPAHLFNLFRLFGHSTAALNTSRTNLLAGLQRRLGILDMPLRFGQFTFQPTAPRINRALAANEPLSETAPLSDNYVAWIHDASIETLRAASAPESTTFRNPLLFHLLRQAALVEYGRVALDLSIAQGLATDLDRIEVELLHISPGTEGRPTHWHRFGSPVGGITGTTTLGAWLLEPSIDDVRLPVREYRHALASLSALPTAELDRLTAETLDTCAYRIDAWVTSLATRKLAALRSARPRGTHLGAFAWVEDLVPLTSPRPGESGGFVHAPSTSHAAAAAVLRSGYLTRTGAERAEIGVNLTSRRVRTGLELIDGVRQGQSLAALLGYRFERAMHAAQLDLYIQPFRDLFALGTDPGNPPSATSERIPARSVVDGLGLRTALGGATTAATIDWSRYPSQIATSDRSSVGACLLQLDADVDATADLALAESVYQAVQGKTDRASATLAALAGGAMLPEPQIAQVPSRALTFTHRVAILLGAPGSLAAGWNGSAPRARADARLDAWAAARLGDPTRVRCTIRYAPDPTKPEQLEHATVGLPALGLCALDVIDLARRVAPNGGGELDARIARAATHVLGIVEPIAIDNGAGAFTSFPEILEVARRLGEMLAGARALLPVDLTRDAKGARMGDTAELLARASQVRTRLQVARDNLATAVAVATSGALRDALWGLAAFGVRSAVPPTSVGNDDTTIAALITAATTSIEDADRRLAEIAAVPIDGGAQLAAALGPEMIVLPVFAADNRADVLAAMTGAPAIVDNDPLATRRWFVGAARVRAPLERARLAALATEALGGARVDFVATQLPLGTRWIGLEYERGADRTVPIAGTLSLVLETAFDTNAPRWAGLVLDEWTEAIPEDTQGTAFAINYDTPGAEAAQCVVLAVPPGAAATWDLDTLIAIVSETADLARVRAIDPEVLEDYSHFIPTTYIAANVANDTIGLDLAAHCMNEDLVLSPE